MLGTATLILIYSAYVAEVFRAGIESVHPSQRAAARSLGLHHRQSMRLVVLPQAVRRVLPPLLNDFVALQKDVGLISVLGAVDAIRAAQIERRAHVQLHPLRGGRAAVRAARDPHGADRGRGGGPDDAPPGGRVRKRALFTDPDRVLELRGVVKRYGEATVLDGIDLASTSTRS